MERESQQTLFASGFDQAGDIEEGLPSHLAVLYDLDLTPLLHDVQPSTAIPRVGDQQRRVEALQVGPQLQLDLIDIEGTSLAIGPSPGGPYILRCRVLNRRSHDPRRARFVGASCEPE